MTSNEFENFCREFSESFGNIGYNSTQIRLLYKHLRFCTVSELRKVAEMIIMREPRFPPLATFLDYSRQTILDAAKRRVQEYIAAGGGCEECQNTGMIACVRHSDPHKRQFTMRCGLCEYADLMGVLPNVPAYTHGLKGIEPVIYSLSLNANPSKGRLDEIKAMPAEKREELLNAEPHIRWALAFYGNKSIPVEPVHRPKYSPWGDTGEGGRF